MATLADLVRSRREAGQGVFGSLGKSLKEKFREKIDPRQFINQTGVLTALFPQLKAFKAKPIDIKKSQQLTQGFDTSSPSVDNISFNTELLAKNTMVLPAIHRDINVMRQNVIKLVKLEGEKPATKADAWFRKAKFTETEYETKIEKSVSKSKPTTKKTSSSTPSTPQKPKSTFAKVGETLSKFAGNKFVQGAAGAAVAVGVGTLAESVGAAESGGRYDIAYADGVRGGKIVNKYGLKTAEEFSGKKLDEMTLSEVLAFQRYRNSTKPNTGAVGKYQFIQSTLFGSKSGPGLVQQLGLSMDTVFNKQTQDMLNQKLYQNDTETLQKAGITPTPGISYMAHYVGAAGAIAVVRAAQRGENISVAQAIKNAGYKDPSIQNEELNRISVLNFEKELEKRLRGNGLKPEAKSKPVPEPTPRNAGDKVNSSSTEVQRGKNAPPTTDVVVQKEKITQFVPVHQSSGGGNNETDAAEFLIKRAVA